MLHRPAFGFAELSWRWSLGFTGCLLFTFAFVEFLRTLPVTSGDVLLLRSRQPALIGNALARILRGSGPRVVETLFIALLCWAVAWVIVGGFGRFATLKALVARFRDVSLAEETKQSGSVRSLFGLNIFRVSVLFAAAIACMAPALAAKLAMGKDTDPTLVFLVILIGTGLIACAWSGLNWFLSLSNVFVVAQGEDTFGAIIATVHFFRKRFGAVLAVSTWFGLARLAAFVIATFCSLFVFGLLGVLPVGFTLLGMAIITLAYFAVADFLYIGRLAGYVAILELPEVESRAIEIPPVPLSSTSQAAGSGGSRIDPDELILSDVPV